MRHAFTLSENDTSELQDDTLLITPLTKFEPQSKQLIGLELEEQRKVV